MNKNYIIFIFISLGLGTVLYIATDNIIVSLIILLASLALSIFAYVPKLKKFSDVVERYHECYHFINNYIISLSIKSSISAALENTIMSMSNSFKEMYEKLEDMNESDKLDYLQSYFPFYSYKLFLQIITLWQDEGGDVLAMSSHLLSEIRYEEEYITTITSLARKKYVESASLWLICLAILVLLRFTLNDFYTRIKFQPIFIISVSIIAAFILLSIYLLIDKGTKISLKGYNPNEKII